MNLDKVFISLGLKTDLKGLATFNKGIKKAVVGIGAVGAASVATGYAMKRFIESSKSSFVGLQNFTDQTGLAVNQLNKLKAAGTSVSLGLDDDNITSGVLALEKTLARLRMGQGNFAPFQMLGIDVLGANAFEVIDQLRDRVKGLDDITATVLIEDIGLDANFLRILRLTDEEFNNLGKNTFLNNKEVKVLNNLNLNIRKMSKEFINLKNKALVKLAPSFNKLIKDGLNWLDKNGDKIINVIQRMAGAFASMLSSVGNVANLIINSADGLKIVGITIGAIVLAISPLTAAIGGVLFLLQDFAKWRADGDAMFKGVYEAISKIPNLKEALGVGAAITAVGILTKSLTKIGKFLPSGKATKVLAAGGVAAGAPEVVPSKIGCGSAAGGGAAGAAGGCSTAGGETGGADTTGSVGGVAVGGSGSSFNSLAERRAS